MKKNVLPILKLIGFIIVFALIQFLTQPFIYYAAQTISSEFMFKLVSVLVEVTAALIIVKLFMWRGSFRELGLRLKLKKRGMLIALSSIPAGLFIMLLIYLLGGFTFEKYLWDKYFMEDTIPIIIAYGLLSLDFAIVEGIAIRGYVYKLVKDISNKYIATVVTALIYAALLGALVTSFNPVQFAGLFLFSVLLTFIFILTKNLSYSIIFHSLWYFITMHLFFVLDPDAPDNYGILNFNLTGSTWLSGGINGPLASLVVVGILLIVDVLLLLKIRSGEK